MKINDLVLKLCEDEAKAKQINVAQMNELIGVMSDMAFSSLGPTMFMCLWRNGFRRWRKKPDISKIK
jgi:hypothetical protein